MDVVDSISTTANERDKAKKVHSLEIVSVTTQHEIEKAKGVIRPEAYKTRLCRYWLENKHCLFSQNCVFAHGEEELRSSSDGQLIDVAIASSSAASKVRPETYKTSLCRNFVDHGTCSFGSKCTFAHGEGDLRIKQPGATPPGPNVVVPKGTNQTSLIMGNVPATVEVPQLLLILGAAERRVQEAETQAQHFQTAMRLLELERVAEREELELRCSIRMEDYRKRVRQLEDALDEANARHSALEGALRQSKVRLEQQNSQTQAELDALRHRYDQLQKLAKRQGGSNVVNEVVESLRKCKVVLQECLKGSHDPDESPALETMQTEYISLVHATKELDKERRKMDASAGKILTSAEQLKVQIDELWRSFQTTPPPRAAEAEAAETSETSQAPIPDSPPQAETRTSPPPAVKVKIEPLEDEGMGSRPPSHPRVRRGGKRAHRHRNADGTLSPSHSPKRPRSSTPPFLPSELLRRK